MEKENKFENLFEKILDEDDAMDTSARSGPTMPPEFEDFYAWIDDLDPEAQSLVDELPSIIDSLPPFVQEWKVAELWSAIRGR